MNENTTKAAIAHALQEFPRESCGLVLVVRGKESYYPCRNMAANPEQDFVIGGEDWADAEDIGEVMAVVHSHPRSGTQASDADKVQCEAHGLPWHIIAVNTVNGEQVCEVATITPNGYKAPLVGRRWHHGVLDCYSLCRDWYAQERGIVLPNYPREDYWWDKGQNLYLELFADAGFEVVARKEGPRIDMSNLQVGDGLLMQLRAPTVNHAAIYIGDGLILQHLLGRLSSRDALDGYFQERTILIVRYKG